MTYDLQGRVAIVTGAGRARGMGSAIALRLAQDGARLVITDVGRPSAQFPQYGLGTSEELQERAAEIRAQGVEVLPLLVDVTREEEVAAMVRQAVSHFGQVNILVANAGISSLRLVPSLEWTKAEWEQTVAVNLIGTWSCCKAVATQMLKQGAGGKIVIMSSHSGRQGNVVQPAYNATKAALINYGQSLALELAPHGINVNVICPGGTLTQRYDRLLRLYYERENSEMPFDEYQALRGRQACPLGRFGTPQEVADLVAFLVSDQSGYITGQAININGGRLMN